MPKIKLYLSPGNRRLNITQYPQFQELRLICRKMTSMYKVAGFVTALLFVASCTSNYPIAPLPADTNPPSLSTPIASYATVDKFYSFGETLPSSEVNKGYTIHFTDTAQNIQAACPGIINSIATNNDGTIAITAQYKINSIYSVYYSGLRSTTLQVNDNISAGSLLGKIGTNGTLYFAIIKNNNEMRCPEQYSSPGFMTSIQQAIDKHNTHNPADSVYAACLIDSLPK
ncbi:MAG: peptidoglycan DD-metalloendopeptidase family protein [Chitinophagales bacterium]